MRDHRIHGVALIVGAGSLLGTAALHPTGGQLLASAESFARYAPMNVLAHSLALFGVWLTFVGLVGLTRKLGPRRADVTAALVAYGLAACMVSLAAITDGLVATRLAQAHVATDSPAQRATLVGLMKFCFNLASSLSRYYVTAVAIAVLLWSWAAWRTHFDRALPWLGAAIALLALVAQARGNLQMNIHDVMLLAVGQGAWMAWAGVALWRSLESDA
jgi:hypothetical protein